MHLGYISLIIYLIEELIMAPDHRMLPMTWNIDQYRVLLLS